MESITLGGVIVQSFENSLGSQSEKITFAANSYHYFYQPLKLDVPFNLDIFESICCTFLSNSNESLLEVSYSNGHSTHTATLKPNQVILANLSPFKVSLKNGSGFLLIAGSKKTNDHLQKFEIHQEAEIKKVTKPWGYELWLTGENKNFAFKKIFIQAGNKTSLQYHIYKHETNLLLEGQAALYFKKNPLVKNDHVSTQDISVEKFNAVTSIEVEPNTIHRIEAISDILLFEVSTPHLDDVIRISDDSQRPNGRIDREHTRI